MTGQRKRLREVWAKVPDVGCKGLCAMSCGPIGASRLEVRLLEGRGFRLEAVATVVERMVQSIDNERPVDEIVPDCPALVDGRCSVYDIRPTVCRLWGAVEDMPCPHGCEPVGGLLSRDEGLAIMAESMKVGGHD